MRAFVVLLLAAPLPGQQSPVWKPISPQIAAEQVARCGAGPVTIRSDRELDTDVLVVAGKSAITDAQIVCIADAAGFYDVELPKDAQPRLTTLVKARAAAAVRSESTKWLVEHRLLGAVPKYEAGTSNDAKFAGEVERLCKAKGALSSSYGVHVLSPEWLLRQKWDGSEDLPVTCVLHVAFASGFKLGFIGNAAIAPASK